jgi:recombination protein RecR
MPGDVVAIEKSGRFRGQYHVLRGLLDPIRGVTIDDLTIDVLVDRVKVGSPRELILALSPTREGEATCRLIATLLVECDLEITRLAHGVPLGGHLEFVDEGTLSLAMEHRRRYPEVFNA